MSNSVKILGTGSYLPDHIVTNEDLCKIIDSDDEWIQKRTGIKQRHIAVNEGTWELALNASKQAMENAGVTADQIQVIVATTVTPDYYYPSLSCIMAKELGIHQPLTIDASCACAGFTYGLDLARRYLMDDDVEHVLLVSSEELSKQVDYTDPSTCVIFGDGAGAMVLGKGEGIFAAALRSEQANMERLFSRAHPLKNPWTNGAYMDDLSEHKEAPIIAMDGKDTFRFAVGNVPKALKEACSKAKVNVEDLDYIILHQANMRIIAAIAKDLKMDIDKFLNNIAYRGNTSSASIPICFHENWEEGILKKGQLIGVSGFGAGLAFGACVFEIL